jgi:hypothetical protein
MWTVVFIATAFFAISFAVVSYSMREAHKRPPQRRPDRTPARVIASMAPISELPGGGWGQGSSDRVSVPAVPNVPFVPDVQTSQMGQWDRMKNGPVIPSRRGIRLPSPEGGAAQWYEAPNDP